MAEDIRIVEGKVSLPYRWATGPVFARFLDELKNKKIMGTKCPSCKRVLIPARKFCPRCFEENLEWVQVSDKGKIQTWSLITFDYVGQPKPPPYISALIELDGSQTSLAHFVDEIDFSDVEKVHDQVHIGMRVEAKWSEDRHGNIMDIEYFRPLK